MLHSPSGISPYSPRAHNYDPYANYALHNQEFRTFIPPQQTLQTPFTTTPSSNIVLGGQPSQQPVNLVVTPSVINPTTIINTPNNHESVPVPRNFAYPPPQISNVIVVSENFATVVNLRPSGNELFSKNSKSIRCGYVPFFIS